MSDWKPALTHADTHAALEDAIDAAVALAKAELRHELRADVTLTTAERDSMMALANPLIDSHIRETFEGVWLRLVGVKLRADGAVH